MNFASLISYNFDPIYLNFFLDEMERLESLVQGRESHPCKKKKKKKPIHIWSLLSSTYVNKRTVVQCTVGGKSGGRP
jgi:hypothetical protein